MLLVVDACREIGKASVTWWATTTELEERSSTHGGD